MFTKKTQSELKSNSLEFGYFKRLPEDAQINILNNLSSKDLANFASGSKELKTLAVNAGNAAYEDIVRGQILLNNAPENIQKYLSELDKNEKINLLIALRYGFITIYKLGSSPIPWLKAICKDNVISALKENIVSADYIGFMSAPILEATFSDNGLRAFREKLITVKDLGFFSADYINEIFSNNGITALREKLITKEEIMRMLINQLRDALSDQAIQSIQAVRRANI